MTRDGVIVDTSVLIDFLKDKAPIAEAVAALITSKRIRTTGIIMAELLQGARTAQEEAYAVELLDGMPSVEVTSALWLKAGRLSCSLRRKGLTLPLSDIAIAALAIEHNLSVFTLDRHFKDIPGVKLHKTA
jgi:predicted nucleic acid-binding protein